LRHYITARYLERTLGKNGAVNVIAKMPRVLSLSVERDIGPAARFLLQQTALGREGAAKAIVRWPRVLGLSVAGNLAPTWSYLEEELALGSTVGRCRLIVSELVLTAPMVSALEATA